MHVVGYQPPIKPWNENTSSAIVHSATVVSTRLFGSSTH